MQSTHSAYGSPYLATCHVTFTFKTDLYVLSDKVRNNKDTFDCCVVHVDMLFVFTPAGSSGAPESPECSCTVHQLQTSLSWAASDPGGSGEWESSAQAALHHSRDGGVPILPAHLELTVCAGSAGVSGCGWGSLRLSVGSWLQTGLSEARGPALSSAGGSLCSADGHSTQESAGRHRALAEAAFATSLCHTCFP